MVQNDKFIKLMFDVKDAIENDNVDATEELSTRINEICTSEMEQRLIEEEFHQNQAVSSQTIISFLQKVDFIADKELKVATVNLSNKLRTGTISPDALVNDISQLGDITGADTTVREYLLLMIKACSTKGNEDTLPVLREKLKELNVIGG